MNWQALSKTRVLQLWMEFHFPDVNTGAKIQAGLDIISGLQEIYQVRMPIFIDNAEAVTHWMIDLNCQQIKLYADEKYKTLTFFANGEKQEG